MNLGLGRNEVRLEPHHAGWQGEFKRVKREILAFVPILEDKIEHIGSTSIVGMIAKPIIDMVAGVNDIEKVDKEFFGGLAKAGFLRLKVQRPSEIVLAKFTDETYQVKTHYIHLVNYDKDLWKNLIFFRDYLNSNPNAREQYKNLKLAFLEHEQGGITEYTNYKEQFVMDIYAKRM